jgi:hypothetical protein
MRWRFYCNRLIKTVIAIILIIMGNHLGFMIALHSVRLGMSETDLRRALWPYGADRKIRVGDSWKVWQCSPFPWSGFMRPENEEVSEKDFQEKTKLWKSSLIKTASFAQ